MDKEPENGVVILLESGMQLRRNPSLTWLWRDPSVVSLAYERLECLGGRKVRSLTIFGGKADFIMGGIAIVKMPGKNEFHSGLPGVLAIYTIPERCIKNNPRLCRRCNTLARELVKCEPPHFPLGPWVGTFRCGTCGHKDEDYI